MLELVVDPTGVAFQTGHQGRQAGRKAGLAEAQLMLGSLSEKGQVVPAQRRTSFAEAQYQLGRWLRASDPTGARHWLTAAAAQQHQAAALALREMEQR